MRQGAWIGASSERRRLSVYLIGAPGLPYSISTPRGSRGVTGDGNDLCDGDNDMNRFWMGLVCVIVGLVLALVGHATLGPDLHHVATGLIAVGLVMGGAALIEKRLDAPHDARTRRD